MGTFIRFTACGALIGFALMGPAWAASAADDTNKSQPTISQYSTGAPSDAERADLARLIQDLNALEPLLTQARRDANPDARVKFQYRWLRADLDKIKRGIRAYLDGTRDLPRSIKPLQGDYVQ
jgi:RAQPRD family integrative conjugative element protein